MNGNCTLAAGQPPSLGTLPDAPDDEVIRSVPKSITSPSKPEGESYAETKAPNSANPSPTPTPNPDNPAPPTDTGSQTACSSAKSQADWACGSAPPSTYSATSDGINSYGSTLAAGSNSAANANYQWGLQCTDSDTSAGSTNSFNRIDPLGALNTNQNPYQPQQPYGAEVNRIPNGGGGLGLGSVQGATLGGRPHGYASAATNRADIMQGERGGGGFAGYGSGPQSSNDEFNASNIKRAGRRSPATTGGYLGMDLKRFLPGGASDPQAQIGGLSRNSEIMGRTADLFRHVSDRIQEYCRLGHLYDCR